MSTPAESNGPTFTASGRQVRSRHGGTYGETRLRDATNYSRHDVLTGAEVEEEDDEDEPVSRGRPRRAAQQNRVKAKPFSQKNIEGYGSLGSMDDESDATSSGNEWDGGDDDEADDHVGDEEEEDDVDMSDTLGAEEEDDSTQQSLVVSLRYLKSHPSPPNQDTRNGPATFEGHSISPVTTSNPNELSETADPTDDLTKSLDDMSGSSQDAAPTQYSRSAKQHLLLHHATLTEHAPPAQYTPPTVPPPRTVRFGQSKPIAAENDHTQFQPDYSTHGGQRSTTASWERPETGKVAPPGARMSGQVSP